MYVLLIQSGGGKVEISPVYRTMKPMETSFLSLVLMKAGLLHVVASRHMSVIKVSFSGLEGLFIFLLYILQQNYWLFQKSPFITH